MAGSSYYIVLFFKIHISAFYPISVKKKAVMKICGIICRLKCG
jgi:hypothetical protein